jgi:hypothetical protein
MARGGHRGQQDQSWSSATAAAVSAPSLDCFWQRFCSAGLRLRRVPKRFPSRRRRSRKRRSGTWPNSRGHYEYRDGETLYMVAHGERLMAILGESSL